MLGSRMRIHKFSKKRGLIGVVSGILLLAVCFGIAGYQNRVKAGTTKPVVTRGVIDDISQIPETKRTAYAQGTDIRDTLGTTENPFVILEIVPYEEYAEFGYQISGCEPVNVEQMQYGNGYLNTISSGMGSGSVTQRIAYFFLDEIDTRYAQNYSSAGEINEKSAAYQGYYEKVEENQGFFVQGADGTIQKAGAGKGNIIWHTVNEFEKQENPDQYGNQKFEDDTTHLLSSVGERIYTTRISTEADPVQKTQPYYEYKSYDHFLRTSLNLQTDDAVASYSVIIKTITPEELNSQPEWVDDADLFVVSPKSHVGNASEIWKKFNRLNKTSNTTSYQEGFGYTDEKQKDKRDITWNVALKMYKKINAEVNYAAIVMDTQSYTDETLTGGKKVTTDILNWNLKPSGETESTYMGYNINMYKLAVMLLSMDSDLFEKLYLSGDQPLIQDGRCLAQTGDAQEYWTMFTFLPTTVSGEKVNWDWYHYWTSADKWENYGTAGNITTDGNRNYVNHRLFTFNSDNSITQGFGSDCINTGAAGYKFTSFKEFMGDKTVASPADAVRYILGERSPSEYIKKDLNILDIEPCYDSKNGYELTESYIRLMIPKLRGEIHITHMTTAAFIGSTQDLNSTYDMIFMGLDDGAYNHETKNIQSSLTGIWSNVSCTKWNDSSMDGKIYFHTGDSMDAAEYTRGDGRSRSVKFLVNGTKNGNQWSWNILDSIKLRFPGNDLTRLKVAELKDYINAGYPVVAVPYLYNNDEMRIDQTSNISGFIRDEVAEKANIGSSVSIYQADDVKGITSLLQKAEPEVKFTLTPKLYDGTTGDDGKVIANANYLDTDGVGRSLLSFGFTVTDPDNNIYRCRIYLDQNQDGKFEDDELYYEGSAFASNNGAQAVTCKLSRLYFGLVQWKIEVAQEKNDSIRFVQTGCSAAANQTGQKKEINVLQLLPKSGDFDGKLDLSSDPLFTKYYKSLDGYEIHVTTETLDQFSEHFKNKKFTEEEYDKLINDPNLTRPDWMNVYKNYNMIIVGFGDTYGGKNVPNSRGEMDFIKFFIGQGKSVLFTHDLTSVHNMREQDFGYSANTLLRDTMGMNRYKAISKNMSDDQKLKIAESSDDNYDFVKSVTGKTSWNALVTGKALDEKHGFTYYAMKRLGWNDGKSGTSLSTLMNQRMPYQYLITSTNGKSTCGATELTRKTGFNNNNDLTTTVTQTNQGQITQYPFKIDETLQVANTHGQWYQLNMEDPEVTVWYCLSDDQKYPDWQGNDSNKPGTAATYGVSPNDAANNYYIYSKGNVFYSGVGHSKVTGDMEAKLFINTMIAAYRASYVPPMVEVLNENAELMDMNNPAYVMNFAQEYNDDPTDTALITADADNPDTDDMVRILFCPEELNAISTKLDCSIYYTDENNQKVYVDQIYDSETDQEISSTNPSESDTYKADEDGKTVFKNVKNMKEYYFYYPKKYLEGWTETEADGSTVSHNAWRNIIFQVKNNKNKEPGYTKLDMSVQQLFLLD